VTTLHRTLSLFAVAALAAAAASQAMAKEQPVKTWKASIAAHLRAAPSSQSPVIASVPKDTLLTSFQPCARGWCAVEYKGFRGWIYDIFLVEQPVKAAPQMAPAPQPLAKASLQRPLPAPPPAPVALAKEDARAYRVIGLGAEESLPVREGPLDTARVVGTLPSGTTAIARLEACWRPWCLVEHYGVRGYIQSRFLGRLDTSSEKYGVDGETNLEVRSFAGPEADVVGEIPFYAGGIVPIGDCNGEWCHVRYLGLVGFVDTRRLRPESSPQG